MTLGYLKFTGDYAELKNLGYKFQKLFANNYMSWSKNRVFIFKKGSDITHGNIDLYKLVMFLKTNPIVRSNGKSISFFKFYTNEDTNEYEYYPITKENITKYRANLDEWGKWDKDSGIQAPECMSMEHVGNDLMEQIKELTDRGWVEPTVYTEEELS